MKDALQTLIEDLRDALAVARSIRVHTWILLGLCGALVAGWILVSAQLSPAFFPSPSQTGEALFWMLMDVRQDYLRAIGNSLAIYFSGLALALAIGWVAVFLMGLWPIVGRVLGPCIDFVGSIPNIAFMPLIVALVGLGDNAKILVVFIAAIIPIVISGFSALRQIDRGVVEAAYVLGAGEATTLWRVVWPLALPQMVAGLRIGSIQALAAAVIAEIYTAMTGLGGLLVGYGNSFNMARYFVVVITLAFIGVGTTAILRRVEHILARRTHLDDKGN